MSRQSPEQASLVAFLDGSKGTISYLEARGLFAALAIIPRMVAPGEWLPIVLGTSKAERPEVLLPALMELYNAEVEQVRRDARKAVPKFKTGDQPEWGAGFLRGLRLDWDAVTSNHECASIAVFMMVLSGEASYDGLAEDLKITEEKWRKKFGKGLPGLIRAMYEDLEEPRANAPVEPAPVALSERVGRNDPCPCGSGKKFKKCCG